MRIAIVGSRSLEGRRSDVLDVILNAPWMPPNSDDVIVTGGADGVDSYAMSEANVWNTEVDVIEPDWEQYGPAAGPKRNTEIIETSDVVIVVWDGRSDGTADSLRKAIDQGKPLYCEQI